MKYWLFDVAWLSKLNVVCVTNPPLDNILNLILDVVVINCVNALRCPFNHTVLKVNYYKFLKKKIGLAGPNVWQKFVFICNSAIIVYYFIKLSMHFSEDMWIKDEISVLKVSNSIFNFICWFYCYFHDNA